MAKTATLRAHRTGKTAKGGAIERRDGRVKHRERRDAVARVNSRTFTVRMIETEDGE